MDGFGQAAEAFVPVGKEVYVLCVVGDAARDCAFFQADGNDEDCFQSFCEGAFAGAV